ncbi:MAG: argonaute/piwi family protein [Geminicoccaceae bacterium]
MSSNPVPGGPLLLNGFQAELPEEIDVIVRPMTDPGAVKAERDRLAGHWFVHWHGGELCCLRLKAGGPNLGGRPARLKVADYPWLLRARLDDVIATVFDRYPALRLRPFSFLSQRDEIVATAAKRAQICHPLLSGFHIRPKFTLNAKVVEPYDGAVNLGLFVTLGMRYEVDADLVALQQAGVDLSGLYVIRRQPAPGQRRLVGRIDTLADGVVHLSEATGDSTAAATDVRLEGSLENFSRCLKVLLGSGYGALRDGIEDVEANFRIGPEFDAVVERMGEFLRRKSPVALAQGVEVRIGNRLAVENGEQGTSVYVVPPVEYVYDRAGSRRHRYAWTGLQNYGPYDRTTFAKKSPRILVVYPASAEGKVEVFLKALRDGMPPSQRGFPNGFAKTFGLLNPDFLRCSARVSGTDCAGAEAAYRRAIEAYLEKDSAIDASIVAILDEHAQLPTLQNPYIRTKALFLTLGIPTQQVRLATINQRPASLQYTLQNFSVSLYAKLNGTPWTVDQDQAISDEIVVGMGMAELSGSRTAARQRFVGITTVFGGDGTYLLGNVSRECAYDDYAAMIRQSMVAVLEEVKTRNNWHPDDTVRVIFHAHKPLKRDEVAKIAFACAKQVGSAQNLQMAFVTVSHDHPFFLFDPEERGIPVSRDSSVMKGVTAPARGTIARLGPWTRLLAVNSHTLIKRAQSPLPKPLLINLHQDSTFLDLDYLAEQVLKFTALSWRSTLPAGTPVTIYYSERIAELLARLRQVPDWSPTALQTRLRWSRWFL